MTYEILVGGEAEGELLVLEEPLSLWGGLDPESGSIIEPRHPQAGESMSGRIVAMPGGRGSSSSSTVLAEAMRLGTAPAGFILETPDPILAIGSLVGSDLYHRACPIVVGPVPQGRELRVEIFEGGVRLS